MNQRRTRVWGALLAAVLLLQPVAAGATAPVRPPAQDGPAAPAAVHAVVGTGTPASCDGNALEAAVTAGGLVTFNCGPAPHTILVNTMVIGPGLNVTVEGAGQITLDGEALRQIFLVQEGGTLALQNIVLDRGSFFTGGAIDSAGTVTLKRVTIRNGLAEADFNSSHGGAIMQRAGTLTVDESSFEDNRAVGAGGALYVAAGQATIRTSLFEGNTSSNHGGAIFVAGGTLTVENSTFSQNQSSDGSGGALRSEVGAGSGAVTVQNATFYLNDAAGGGGSLSTPEGDVQPIALGSSALYVNPDGPLNCALGGGPSNIQTADFNWASDDSCGLEGANDRQQNVDPLLAPLAANGGPTLTHAPNDNSPLVDFQPAPCPLAADQKLLPRPQAALCDIGASERVPGSANVPINQPNVAPFYLGKVLVRPIIWPILTQPNVAADVLEVTQGIQEKDGSGVVLVAGKRTYVRFHVWNTAIIGADPVVGARLWRIVNGQRVGEPLRPSSRLGDMRFVPFRLGSGISSTWVVDPFITVRKNPDRNALNDSFYFRLPADWTAAGSLTIEAEVNPTFLTPTLNEANRADNILRTTVTFQSTPTMILRLFSVRTRINNVVQEPTATQLAEVENWLRRAYPIASLRVIRDVEDMTNLGRLPTCDQVNGRLFWDNLFLKWAGIDRVDTRYYGLVSDGPAGGNFMRGCAADIPSSIASGPTGDPSTQGFANWDTNNDGSSYGDWYTGHELGHTWGRAHVNCRGDEAGPDPNFPQQNGTIGRKNNADTHWGFDIHLKGPVVYPPTWTDIMTYCNNEWMSAYTYTAIRGRLVSENSSVQAAEAAGLPAPVDSLVIQGTVTLPASGATIEQAYRLTAPDVVPASPPSPWAIRLLGAGGAVLATYPFTPNTDSDAEEEATHGWFVEQVPWVNGTQVIQIIHQTSGVLAQRAVSASAPTATLSAPTDPVTVGPAGLTVSWTASDADGGTLVSTILFSRDGGATFAPLRLHLPTAPAPAVNTVVIPLAELAQTTQGAVRVLVSDGVNTGQATSAPGITVPNLPPVVSIQTPAPGMVAPYGTSIELEASAIDPEDAPLSDGQFVWSSSIDGPLGVGAALAVELLSPGTHTLTVLVTDAGGAQASATRTVIVSGDAMVNPAAVAASPGATNLFVAFASNEARTQALSIRNNAGGEVAWQATDNAPWLTLSATGGQTPAEVTLTANSAGLPVGVHVATVTITFPGAANPAPARTVRVWLVVEGERMLLPIVRK